MEIGTYRKRKGEAPSFFRHKCCTYVLGMILDSSGSGRHLMVTRRLALLAVLVLCLALSSQVWAGTLQFAGNSLAGQGLMSFTPGAGAEFSIGAGNGANGALITDFLSTSGICSGDCSVTAGYLTLTTGTEASQTIFPGGISYTFNSGGSIKVIGGISSLGIANGTTLFSATFLPGAGFSVFGGSGSFQGGVDLVSIILDPLLGKYIYQSGSVDEFFFNVDPACATGGVCTGTISQSTVQMTAPEPATLSVLGVGLFVSGAGLRRKMTTR